MPLFAGLCLLILSIIDGGLVGLDWYAPCHGSVTCAVVSWSWRMIERPVFVGCSDADTKSSAVSVSVLSNVDKCLGGPVIGGLG